jgi:uracil-DNA glycosylase family 4
MAKGSSTWELAGREVAETPLDVLNDRIIHCRLCPRLVAYREEVARVKRRAYREEAYWGRPVPGFGDPAARVLVVGLAPGAHGANRTGRMFTGDNSGQFLYAALYRAGFANQPTSVSADDGLALRDLYISAACRCAPPDNKPTPQEEADCLPYLLQEIALLDRVQVVAALGRIGFDSVLRAYRGLIGKGKRAAFLGAFAHGASQQLGDDLPWLVSSYHPSQQNTQTGRLTPEMFDVVWRRVRELLRDDE